MEGLKVDQPTAIKAEKSSGKNRDFQAFRRSGVKRIQCNYPRDPLRKAQKLLKTPDPNQLNFFNEAGTSADPSAPEPTKTEVVKGYDRKQKSTRTDSFGDLPIHKVLCHVNEKDKTYPLCGEQMKLVGKRFVREELQIIPARVKRVHYYQEVYACPKCKKEDEEFVTTAADTPVPLMKHSPASPSTVARVMYQKYAISVPLYRMEQDWLQNGVRLLRLERLYKGKDPEELKELRLKNEKPIVDNFYRWVNGLHPVRGSKLAIAVTYAKNQRASLENHFKDGRLELSNSSAERKVKSYVMGRKNFLFHNSVDGAKASAVVCSIVETAKENSLNIFQYLQTLLLYMPDHKK